MTTRTLTLATAAVVTSLLASGCAPSLTNLEPLQEDFTTVAAPTTTTVPNASPKPQPQAAPTTTSKKPEVDSEQVVKAAVADAQDYWRSLGVTVDMRLVPSGSEPNPDCKDGNGDLVWLCTANRLTYNAWATHLAANNEGAFAVAVRAAFPAAGAALRKISTALGTRDMAELQRRSCAAGAYARWVEDGHSSRFRTTFEEIESLSQTLFPEGGGDSINREGMRRLLNSFKAGYAHSEPCLKGVLGQ